MLNKILFSRIAPSCLWAQRKDKIYLTIRVPDIADEIVKVEAKQLYFR